MRRSCLGTGVVALTIAAVCAGCSGPTIPTDPSNKSSSTASTPAQPPTAAAPNGISLLNVSPESGSTFVVTETTAVGLALSNFQATFGAAYSDALPDAKLEVELLDPAGAQCWYGFYDHAVSAGTTATIPVAVANGMLVSAFQNGSCGTFPEHLASVRATLLTLRGPEVNGHLTRTDYLTQTFPLVYTVERYPPVPPHAPATAPTIASIAWTDWATPSDPVPVPGDNVFTGCTVTEADGAPMTITVTVAFDGTTPLEWTGTTPVAASASPGGASFGVNFTVPSTLKFPPALHAKVTCDAANDRGQTATKSIDIGTAR